MKVLIQNATIIDSASTHSGSRKDIAVVDGKISQIADSIDSKSFETVISGKNLSVSGGWIDAGVHYKDPGEEWLENLESLQNAALDGGVTTVVGFPNTHPTVQSKESLSYFKNFSKYNLVNFENLGAVTKNCEGKDFTDMMDLHFNGAVGFSDGKNPIQSSDILLKTLQYLQPLGTLLVNKSEDKYLSMFGQMHEGLTSTMLGLKGIPSAAEEIMIMRDLKLLEYSGIQSDKPLLHFSTISTEESVQLIREAKQKGLPVSCDIAAHQLAFTDDALLDFDTNLKVFPPFRSQKDIRALKEGLLDGTIDMIVSDHNPLDAEHKNVEFDVADFGIVGIQTLFQVVNTYSGLSIEMIINKIVNVPRRLFGLEINPIEVGQWANLTIFDSEMEVEISERQLKSLSKNSPFVGKKLRGRALAVFNNNRFKVLEN
ncbi:MAG TPA: dihydroorotase [Leadbetterella sp.]|nr:dihydroorotase [Leadbetterella sp.]